MTIETKFNPGDTAFALVTPYDGKTVLRKIKLTEVYIDKQGVVYRDENYRQHREENLYHTAKGAADALLQEYTGHESKLDLETDC